MSNPELLKYTSFELEALENPLKHITLALTPWTVQTLVFELVTNHFLSNDPQKCGFTFSQRYDPDPTESDILIDMSHNWKTDQSSKRPAIFILRDDAKVVAPTMGQTIGGGNVAESEQAKLLITQMDINIACIATNIGFTEQLAEFTRIPFRYFERQIANDFNFRRFRLNSMSKPQKVIENKEHFVVVLSIQTVFDDNWIVKGDDLKIKTVSRYLFDSITKKQLLNQ